MRTACPTRWTSTDATDATYTLVDADLGKTLKVRVTFDGRRRQYRDAHQRGDGDGDPRGRCPWFAEQLVRNGRGRAGRAGMGGSTR